MRSSCFFISYPAQLFQALLPMGDGSAGFAGHVTQGEPGNLDAKVYLKVSDEASLTWAGCLWKEQGHASLVQLAFLSWVQPRETAAPQNQRCIDFCNF